MWRKGRRRTENRPARGIVRAIHPEAVAKRLCWRCVCVSGIGEVIQRHLSISNINRIDIEPWMWTNVCPSGVSIRPHLDSKRLIPIGRIVRQGQRGREVLCGAESQRNDAAAVAGRFAVCAQDVCIEDVEVGWE